MDRNGASRREAFLLRRDKDEAIGPDDRRQAGIAAGTERLHPAIGGDSDPAEIRPAAGGYDLAGSRKRAADEGKVRRASHQPAHRPARHDFIRAQAGGGASRQDRYGDTGSLPQGGTVGGP